MTRYISGRAFEYEIIDDLRNKNYYCIRSAGSKGLVDIIALDIIANQILLIQCKKYSGSKPKPSKEFVDWKVPSNCIKIWITKKKGKKFVEEIL